MSEFAWVTLATNDSYSLGALVLAHSLRETASKFAKVVLVTPGVSASMRAKLAAAFNIVEEVNILDSKDEKNLRLLKRPELGITFTKLHCWRLTQFKKCVFLDADVLVLKNVDDLFERDEFSAAPDVGWPDCFNSGVFVYRPSIETYDKLIQFALDNGSFDGGDQGLLNSYFSEWAQKDISKHLPFIYNMCSVACYSYLPAYKRFGTDVKIVHFIGSTKPWLQYFNSETKLVQPSSEVEHLQSVLQIWWDIFVKFVHANLTADMGGLAGAFAQFSVGAARTQDQRQLEDSLRKQSWEVGSVDYLGRDSFDRIWSKISESISTPPQGTEQSSLAMEDAKATETKPVVDEKPVEPAAPATTTDQPTADIVDKAVQESLQPQEKSDVPAGPAEAICTKPQETVSTEAAPVIAEATPVQEPVASTEAQQLKSEEIASKPEETSKIEGPAKTNVNPEAASTPIDSKNEQEIVEKLVDKSAAATEGTVPVAQTQEKVEEKAPEKKEQAEVESPALVELKPTEIVADAAAIVPEVISKGGEAIPEAKPVPDDSKTTPQAKNEEVVPKEPQQEAEKVADEPKIPEGETKPTSEPITKQCDLPPCEAPPTPLVTPSDVAAATTPIEPTPMNVAESATPTSELDVKPVEPVKAITEPKPEAPASAIIGTEEISKPADVKPTESVKSDEPASDAKAEQPSKVASEEKSEEAVKTTTDVKPEEPVKPTIDTKPEEPPKTNADVKPEEPAKCAPDVKSEDPMKITTDVTPQEPPKAATDVKPEERTKVVADAKLEEPPKEAADVKSDEPVKTGTSVQSEESVKPATDAKSEELPKSTIDVKAEESAKPVTDSPATPQAPLTPSPTPPIEQVVSAPQVTETPLPAPIENAKSAVPVADKPIPAQPEPTPPAVATTGAPTGHKSKDAGSQPVAPPRKGSGGKKSKK